MKRIATLMVAGSTAAAALAFAQDQANTQSPQLVEEPADVLIQQQAPADATPSPEVIAQAQEALIRQGYEAGPVVGVITPETMESVKQVQAQNALEPTGELDRVTLALLGVDSTPEDALEPSSGS
jgi:hypothetical protein